MLRRSFFRENAKVSRHGVDTERELLGNMRKVAKLRAIRVDCIWTRRAEQTSRTDCHALLHFMDASPKRVTVRKRRANK